MGHIKRDQHDIYHFISARGRLVGAAKGKSILITGGGKGVGKAIAVQFALAGATNITITGRDQRALGRAKSGIEAESPHCMVTTVEADVTSEDSVSSIFAGLAPGPPPDVLVNNAGVNGDFRIIDSDPQQWWYDWEVNVKGTYLCTRAYLQLLLGKPGTILNVSTSIADSVLPSMSSYATSKMAVNRFTECVQLEHGAQGVRCIAFHPGGIASTGMGQRCPAQFRGRLIDTPELAAGTALYLSTPEAGYLDGRFVFSNWDFQEVEKLKDLIVSDNLLVSRVNYGSFLSTEMMG
ncbi:related to oxidoreductase, short chain dehydrogenase/reductase family [Cephalotrichum gorgonifer]|uniref:Related to oxidoreductase, short chain dehydrogenase/reductase family n=1 Tax=Cephalotrichum gorgonifer TaxID=2041049 RepID=A0AAE8MZA0_9PEZI|nr:related to oxidoreductase, short chain dehydrogenase/reductase family [Cephalotrichum gorgonifer]